MAEELLVRSGRDDVAGTLSDLSARADEESLSLRSERRISAGEWVRFVVSLADETTVIEGVGRCLGSERNGGSFYVHLDELQFDPHNEIVFERILLERESRSSGGPITGLVDLADVEEQPAPSKPPPPPRASKPPSLTPKPTTTSGNGQKAVASSAPPKPAPPKATSVTPKASKPPPPAASLRSVSQPPSAEPERRASKPLPSSPRRSALPTQRLDRPRRRSTRPPKDTVETRSTDLSPSDTVLTRVAAPPTEREPEPEPEREREREPAPPRVQRSAPPRSLAELTSEDQTVTRATPHTIDAQRTLDHLSDTTREISIDRTALPIPADVAVRAAALVPSLERAAGTDLSTQRVLLTALRVGLSALEAHADPDVGKNDDE